MMIASYADLVEALGGGAVSGERCPDMTPDCIPRPRRRSLPTDASGALGRSPERAPTLRTVKTFRRGLFVGLLAVLIGLVVRLRGKGEVAPTTGGWRELEGPDFR
jgi:hypothetical protein